MSEKKAPDRIPSPIFSDDSKTATPPPSPVAAPQDDARLPSPPAMEVDEPGQVAEGNDKVPTSSDTRPSLTKACALDIDAQLQQATRLRNAALRSGNASDYDALATHADIHFVSKSGSSLSHTDLAETL